MKKINAAILGALSLATTLSACIEQQPGGVTPTAIFDRVIVIVLENTNYSDAIADPYLASVAARGALLTNFEGLAHPSYANYLDMVGGRKFATLLDTQRNLDEECIADRLEDAGFTWRGYAENYGGNCDLSSTSGLYARKHMPLLSFKSIQNNPVRCAMVVPGDQFQKDLTAGTLPNYSFYTPNLNDDGHNTDLPTASAWLKGFLEPILANSDLMKRTLIEITFDESKTYLNNHIYTVLLGSSVKVGATSSQEYDHFNVLRTIEDNFGLGAMGDGDGDASAITDVFETAPAASSARGAASRN